MKDIRELEREHGFSSRVNGNLLRPGEIDRIRGKSRYDELNHT